MTLHDFHNSFSSIDVRLKHDVIDLLVAGWLSLKVRANQPRDCELNTLIMTNIVYLLPTLYRLVDTDKIEW